MERVTPRRFREVDTLFDAALDRPEGEREAFVEEASGGDADLRDAVLRLLGSHGRSEGFLETPAAEFAQPLLAALPLPGQSLSGGEGRVGPWRLVRELGRGGMGTVFLAERDDGQFRQRVALKLIRRAGGGRDANRRFLEERRILALLEHPGIARLVDGGVTADDQPWFAMELVEGEPLDRFCESRHLPLRRRLDLFLSVCEAVQYAHDRLVVHRDLKPGNILVTDDEHLKLLDFGIAKLLDPLADGGDDPLTGTGLLPMTPEYAAPEQVRGAPVTVATDVYALGVLLHTLLTGERPYEVRGLSPSAVERVVCEEDPPAPSLRDGRLRGDLDVIVLKALRKDPSDRYPSVRALADDIRRYLSGHPVLARPQTAAYRAHRFVRRHRVGVTAVALLVLAGIGYAATLTVHQARIERALAEARAGTARAEQVTDFMMGLFEASEGGRALTDSVTARELLTRGLHQADQLAGQPEMRAQVLEVIGRLHTHLGEYDRARPLLEEALDLRLALHGERHPDVASTLSHLADLAQSRLDVEGTVQLRRQALELRRALGGREDPKTLDAVHAMGLALHQAGDDEAGLALLEDWAATVARHPREATAVRANQLSALAEMLSYRRESGAAEAHLVEALTIRRVLYGDRHPAVAASLTDLGMHFDRVGRRTEAEPLVREAVELLRESYPEGHPRLASTLRMWAIVLEHLGRFDEAVPPLEEARSLMVRLRGEESLDAVMTGLDLAFALTVTGHYDPAVELSRTAVRSLGDQLGPGNSMVLVARTHLGDALRGQGRLDEAEAELLQAWERFEAPRPIIAQWRRHLLAALVRLYEARGEAAEVARFQSILDEAMEEAARVAAGSGS